MTARASVDGAGVAGVATTDCVGGTMGACITTGGTCGTTGVGRTVVCDLVGSFGCCGSRTFGFEDCVDSPAPCTGCTIHEGTQPALEDAGRLRFLAYVHPELCCSKTLITSPA